MELDPIFIYKKLHEIVGLCRYSKDPCIFMGGLYRAVIQPSVWVFNFHHWATHKFVDLNIFPPFSWSFLDVGYTDCRCINQESRILLVERPLIQCNTRDTHCFCPMHFKVFTISSSGTSVPQERDLLPVELGTSGNLVYASTSYSTDSMPSFYDETPSGEYMFPSHAYCISQRRL